MIALRLLAALVLRPALVFLHLFARPQEPDVVVSMTWWGSLSLAGLYIFFVVVVISTGALFINIEGRHATNFFSALFSYLGGMYLGYWRHGRREIERVRFRWRDLFRSLPFFLLGFILLIFFLTLIGRVFLS